VVIIYLAGAKWRRDSMTLIATRRFVPVASFSSPLSFFLLDIVVNLPFSPFSHSITPQMLLSFLASILQELETDVESTALALLADLSKSLRSISTASRLQAILRRLH
jgi:hypothetical protein